VGTPPQPGEHGRRREAIARLAAGLRTGDPAELLCGAWLGASSFAVAGSGLHHKLCHVLGGTFGLPHARTHAVVLPHVLAFNAPGAPEAVARVARALGTDDAVSGLRALADEHGRDRQGRRTHRAGGAGRQPRPGRRRSAAGAGPRSVER
jgi:hypothetical protein